MQRQTRSRTHPVRERVAIASTGEDNVVSRSGDAYVGAGLTEERIRPSLIERPIDGANDEVVTRSE